MPINFGVNQLVKIGKQRVQIGGGAALLGRRPRDRAGRLGRPLQRHLPVPEGLTAAVHVARFA